MNGVVLNSSTSDGFCILAQLVPCRTYYSEEMVLKASVEQTEGDLKRQRREPISLTLALIPGAGLAQAGTGLAMLALQEKTNYNSLNADINEDIQCLERSISHLEQKRRFSG